MRYHHFVFWEEISNLVIIWKKWNSRATLKQEFFSKKFCTVSYFGIHDGKKWLANWNSNFWFFWHPLALIKLFSLSNPVMLSINHKYRNIRAIIRFFLHNHCRLHFHVWISDDSSEYPVIFLFYNYNYYNIYYNVYINKYLSNSSCVVLQSQQSQEFLIPPCLILLMCWQTYILDTYKSVDFPV